MHDTNYALTLTQVVLRYVVNALTLRQIVLRHTRELYAGSQMHTCNRNTIMRLLDSLINYSRIRDNTKTGIRQKGQYCVVENVPPPPK